jgi:hypothetical protein
LAHEAIWFGERERSVIAEAWEGVIRQRGYTAWACAVCSNHGHVMTRVHRDEGHLIWQRLADVSRDALLRDGLAPAGHPVWSARPYVVFKKSVDAVERGIDYIEKNPMKEGLPRQHYEWVVPYDGWPCRGREK